MKFYAYCVAETVQNIDALPPGLEGQKVDVLEIDDLVVVVSKFSGDAAVVNRENVICHDSVIRSVFAESTPLPFRFGTLISESNVVSYIRSRHDALLRRLGFVKDSAEMNVKVIWNNAEEVDREDGSRTDLGPGAAFLLEKQRELRGAERLKGEAEGISTWLDGLLSRVCKDSRVNIEPRQKLVYSGAYLLSHSEVPRFRDIMGEANSERPDLHFLVSGPWPPYTFADIDLEFKSQFGVS